jgi:hypothetical protein
MSHNTWCFANHSDCGGRRWASYVRQLGEARELHSKFNTGVSGITARDLGKMPQIPDGMS